MQNTLKVVLVTCPSHDVAISLARTLVGQNLAACVNVLSGITSVYQWEGKINQDSEHLLVIKTLSSKIPELEQKIYELHPYSTPEFVVLDSAKVGAKYLQWFDDVMKN